MADHGERASVSEETLLSRITADPAIFGGKPIIRGRRLAVEHVLGMLTAGDSPETILSGYTWLEPDDVRACLVYDRLRGGPRTRRASAFQPRCKGRPQALVSAALDSMAALQATLKQRAALRGSPRSDSQSIRLFAAVDDYLQAKQATTNTVRAGAFDRERLEIVTRVLATHGSQSGSALLGRLALIPERDDHAAATISKPPTAIGTVG